MKTACEICYGACCETVIQEYKDKDEFEWMLLRGKKKYVSCIEFELRCKHLEYGKCAIYEDRPLACKNYSVGSELCLNTVKERRGEEILAQVKESINK